MVSSPLIDTESVKKLHLARLSNSTIIDQQTKSIHNLNTETTILSELGSKFAVVKEALLKNKDYIKEGKESRVEMVKKKKMVDV